MAAWLKLFDTAMAIIEEAERMLGGKIDWTIGGGTMLQKAFQHRHSKDIDIFLGDPQLLSFLSPRLNEVAACHVEGDGRSYVDSDGLRRAFAAIQAERYAPMFEHCASVIRRFVERNRTA